MAVASDDLPRLSLLSGTSGVHARALTKETEDSIVRCLSRDFTWETWLQIRSAKAKGVDGHGCWWIHSPSWACGLTTELRVVIYDDGDWFVSASSPSRPLQGRRWHHLAVSRKAQARSCEVLVDGEVVQMEALQSPERLQLPVSPSAGFRVGWSPLAESPCQLLLHEVRLWSSCLSASVIRRWLNATVSCEHPLGAQLTGHWTFSSGSLTPTEYDLSFFGHDLVVENATGAHWLRAAPPGFQRSGSSDVVRLVAYQGANTEDSSRQSRFVVELEVMPHVDVVYSACQDVTVVLMLNFPCFPSPSLTLPDRGTSFIRSLQELVQRLPSNFSLAFYDAGIYREGSKQPIFVCDALDEDAKARACRALDRVVVKKPISASELVPWFTDSVRGLEVRRRHGSDEKCLFVCSAIVVTDTNPDNTDQELIDAVDILQDRYSSVTVHVIQVGSVAAVPRSTPEHPKISSLVTHYTSCESDFEWVVAVIISQMREIVATGAQLTFETVGDASFAFAEESQPIFSRYTGTAYQTHLVVPVGSYAYSNRLQLAGIATFPKDSLERQSYIATTLTYFTGDKRRHVSQVSLQPAEDIVDHFYIEYAVRNKRLQITDNDFQLLDQRRDLMRRKTTFLSEFVSHEVAEAENAFKKINIMKEELWAKRKWLVSRSLRLFEELEVKCLVEEANSARSVFTGRTQSLLSTFTASSRGSDSRGSSRGKNKLGSNPHRVHLDEESTRSFGRGEQGSDEEEQSDEQKLHKVSVKLSVQTKALNEHESKMEDLFVSVRLAEAKGPIIMNDTRRSWVVRYHDMMKSKKAVIDSTLTKDFLQWTLEFHEDREVTRQEVDAEVQSVNAMIARFDKELGKRRKRALLCAKEITGNVVDEFEASESVDAAKRDTIRCRLMRTLSITHDMFAACVYVCFPIEISQQEVPTRASARGFSNLIHGVCAGLRQMCDAASESPVCRRLAFGEAFLWWGLEQQEVSVMAEKMAAAANREQRHAIQAKAWAFIVVSYNSLFSSAAALAEVKGALAVARDQAKPVFHIQLESAYDGLDDFRSQWTCRLQSEKAISNISPPVEREFLTWKQNFSSFQSLLSSVGTVESILVPSSLRICSCDHIASSSQSDSSWRYPCTECLWPIVGSSSQATPEQDAGSADSSQENSDLWFLRLVCQIGTWVDATNSVSLQNAPRSYHIDPNAVSSLSYEWNSYQLDQVRQLSTKWNEASSRRTKEIQRQVGKLFKVYEEEARDMVALQFKLVSRREEVMRNMNDQLNNLIDERKLLETWLEKLWMDETDTEHGRRGNESEWMVKEELWQRMEHADAATLYLETLEDEIDSPPDDKLAEAKSALDIALRNCSRALLDLGRVHIEDMFRAIMRGFKKEEYINQIKIANAKCDEQRAQIARMKKVFDQAEQILQEMRQQRDAFVVEDAAAFFNGSCLEIHSPPSVTTQDVDEQQLRKLASDLDFHATFSASIMSQVLQAQLASSTAMEYRTALKEIICAFIDVYTPRVGNYDEFDISSTAASVGFKNFCQFTPEEPAKTYESLLAMRELIDREALEDREAQRVWGEWKIRFIDSLMASHTQRWWTQCGVLLKFLRDQLHVTKAAVDQSFDLRCASERDFREAVGDREKFSHRLTLLQRRLVETRQRQQSLLQLLQNARNCYETSAAVMNDKLQNVKTDVMFKKWSAVSEFHVQLIGTLFDWRSRCSEQLDVLEADIKSCQDSLPTCDAIIASRRQAWLKQSIADNIACTKADGQQQLAHRTVELILTLERQRVFRLFRVLDPRGLWLTQPTLTAWHESYVREYQRQEAIRRAGGKPTVIGRSGVDDLLVQLSIARLDVIKQEKLRDALNRKLRVLGQILGEQVELRNIVENEAQLYRSLGCQMAERVSFLRDQYEASGQSQYLRLETVSEVTSASSIDRQSAVLAVRESRDLMTNMIKAAQQDYLRVEATTCQISWRMREHIACGRRGESAIEIVQSELDHVETYLQVLKAKDRELFELSLQSERPGSRESSAETHSMGMDIAAGRSVFDFYSRDQWFRTCLSQTTALGERIKSLREVLASLLNIKHSASRPSTSDDDGATANDGNPGESDADGQDDQLAILKQELRNAELTLLLNRYESRRAERTSEDLKAALTRRFEGGEMYEAPTTCEIGQLDLDTVLSASKLLSRMFSVGVYTTERERMLVLLREHATRFDPRDVAGNLSEVIFGASLDRNDLKLIFLLQSKAHVDEQWGVALVGLFFARLFRRASLKKAATARKARASALTREKLQALSSQRHAARLVLAMCESSLPSPLLVEPSMNLVHCLLQRVGMEGEDASSTGHLQRVALGILMHRPLHRILAALMPDGANAICEIANEMEERRAIAEHRPPKPTLLHILSRDQFSIKIEWKPITMDHDLIYVAEISEQEPNRNVVDSRASKRYWTQFLTAEKTSHTFYNLHPGHTYWVRVRSGFSRTRLGTPCSPMLVTTLLQ